MVQLTTDPCCHPLRFLSIRYKSFSRRQIPLLGGTLSSPNLKFLGKFPSLGGSVFEGVSVVHVFISSWTVTGPSDRPWRGSPEAYF